MKDPVLMVGEAPFTGGKNIMLLTTSTKNSGSNNCRVTLAILFMVFFTTVSVYSHILSLSLKLVRLRQDNPYPDLGFKSAIARRDRLYVYGAGFSKVGSSQRI